MTTELDAAERALETYDYDRAERLARRVLVGETGRALQEPGRYGWAHEVLARVHVAAGRLPQSVAEWDRAVRLRPTARNLAGLASCLWPTGQYARRAQLLRRAIALDDRPAYHAQLGEMLATLGDWPACWTEYERRHDMPEYRARTGLNQPHGIPRWDGSWLDGRAIAVLHEGGYGDAINFVRYCPCLRGSGAGRVVFQTPAAMVRLVRETGLADEVVDRDGPPPVADCHVPLQSLPYAFGTTPATVPWYGTYVRPTPPQRPVAGPPRVGFVWQGAPHNPTDSRRSADPVEFARFLCSLELPARLVSLQYGAEARQLLKPVAGFARLEWPPVPDDWAETRDLVAGFDLVVTVDTAMTHLAGAMGVPCWTLIAGSNDWRWLTEREDTPWYPSVRLLRMRRPDDWPGLLRRVGEELRTRYGGSP